jgi:hypothetical protein
MSRENNSGHLPLSLILWEVEIGLRNVQWLAFVLAVLDFRAVNVFVQSTGMEYKIGVQGL